MADDERRSGRRGFFAKMILRGIETVEETGKQMGKQVIQSLENSGIVEKKDEYDYSAWESNYVRYLRPPGAVAEWEFPDTCSQCGDCVKACPADAIKLDPDTASGFPYIVARDQPCVVCDDLSCMKECPTGTLKLVEKEKINMGTAIVDQHTCLRCDWHEEKEAEDCRVCIDVCPFGDEAIGLDYHNQIEVREACTGCGLCEHKCPTDPASIWIEESYDDGHDHWHDDYHAYDHDHYRTPNRAKMIRLKRIKPGQRITGRRKLKRIR